MSRPDKKIKIFGEVFAAGIWIYVVDIKVFRDRFFYVGKTGWKNKPKDSSPWQRLAAQLDSGAEKNNCLYTHLMRKKVSIDKCTFELSCFGPNLTGNGGTNTKLEHEIIEEAEGLIAEAIKSHYPFIGEHPHRHPHLRDKAEPIALKILSTLQQSYLKKLSAVPKTAKSLVK